MSDQRDTAQRVWDLLWLWKWRLIEGLTVFVIITIVGTLFGPWLAARL